jgi:hypothetical protein
MTQRQGGAKLRKFDDATPSTRALRRRCFPVPLQVWESSFNEKFPTQSINTKKRTDVRKIQASTTITSKMRSMLVRPDDEQ